MKKILVIIMAIVLLTLPVFADDFKDVENEAWYSEWVGIIKYLNITSGYPDGTYKPDNQLKRIELLSFTMKSLGHEIPVSEGYWGQNIIDKAVEENIITDGSDDLMYTDPEGFISRQETARVIYNAYLKDDPVFTADMDQQVRAMISDINDVSDKYMQGVVGVFASGIVEGYDDQSFKPNNQLTRAEAAVFITRLVLKEKRKKVDFDLNKFEYKTSSVSPGTIDFTTYYTDEHQDIFNILTIIDVLVNDDETDGFAEIKNIPEASILQTWLFTNLEDHDYSGVYRSNYTSWSVQVKKVLDPDGAWIQDYIDIRTWNNNEREEQHYDTMRTVFNYLFEDESQYLWDKYFELAKNPTEVALDFVGSVNSRKVQIASDNIGIIMVVERKIDLLPVDIEKVKVK